MYCLKCGRETENEQVFCKDCLQTMKDYPVKPGTAIQLPKRVVTEEPKKKHRRRNLPPEEQVVHLRAALRWFAAAAVLLAVTLGIVTAMLLYELSLPDPIQPRDLGRNYTAATYDQP